MLKAHTLFVIAMLFALVASAQQTNSAALSRVLAFEGRVEVAATGSAEWRRAGTNQFLRNGDRIRTGSRSRATLQLSDRSILRMNELTTLEIRPPQRSGADAAFEMKSGASYFFNRERPGAVEFRTPLASGAIRGTEFHLQVDDNGRSEVALLDGLVELENELGAVQLVSGEHGIVEAGQAPRKTALLNATAVIQWALYYPAIIDVDELALPDDARTALSESLASYRAGDLLAAVEQIPANRVPTSDSEKVFRAATLLAVGQVSQVTQLVSGISSPFVSALQQLVGVAQGNPMSRGAALKFASEWLAESYALQAQSKLPEALAAAEQAAATSPKFGFAHARVAELEFAFGRSARAHAALDKAIELSPRLAHAHALHGFALAARSRFSQAHEAFDRAIALDSALANGWLGRGLVRIRQGRETEGRQDLQTAATLEPQRSILRSYLGKAWSHTRDTATAEKELRLAKKLDANDPTPWLYSAILAEQQNKVNEAVRDLERSQELNDNRSLFRSRLLLDQDKAVRSVNLARIYQDAGMTDWSVREATRAVSYDYANYSAHQFLANSYEALRDPRQNNLRYEAPATTEYFLASLLAPVGATPLSQTVSQQEYTRLFDRDHAGIASSTEYFSNGDWAQRGVQYGNAGNTDWSLEAYYRTENGQRRNNDLERTDYTLKLRQQITAQDTIYFEGQRNELETGDVLQYHDQAAANPTTRIREVQNPNLFLGYHREWSPGHHTLAFLGRVRDTFHADFTGSAAELNIDANGDLFSTFRRLFDTRFHGDIEGYTAELQQIVTVHQHTIVLGGRFQDADSEARDFMVRSGNGFPGADAYSKFHVANGDIQRQSAYLYDMWQVFTPLHLTAGVAYDRLSFPGNQDTVPISSGERDLSRVSPKAGFIWTPADNSTVRGSYTRSLGGVFFDNSYRLEPTTVAGFNQSFRSLVPESVIGNVAGSRFETFGLGFDQKLRSHTYISVVGELLDSTATRAFGVFERFPNEVGVAATTPVKIDYVERSIAASVNQLVGENWALGARYKLTDADFSHRFKAIPAGLGGAGSIDTNRDEAALLHQVNLYASYTHRCGFFSELNAVWSAQDNREDAAALSDNDFWQLNAFAGYRFWRRHAEARLGVLNITDRDYNLNPLTLYSELPRERTFYASLKFYF